MPSDDKSQLKFFRQDWEAAAELADRRGVAPEQREEKLREFAEMHAKLGHHKFHRAYGLWPARSDIERLVQRRMREEISEVEFFAQIDRDESRPLDLIDFEIVASDLEDRIWTLSRFRGSLRLIVEAFDNGDRPDRHEADADYFARELKVRMSVSQARLFAVGHKLEEYRVRHNLGLIRAGVYSASCSMSLVFRVCDDSALRWESCLQRWALKFDRMYPGTDPSPARYFLDATQKELPNLDELQAIVRQELAAARTEFSAVAPTTTAPAAQSPPGDKGSSAVSRRIVLNRWGVGIDERRGWWLFHRELDRWHQRCRVEIPTGNVSECLEEIAENEGYAHRSALVNRLQKKTYGALAEVNVLKIVKESISKARAAIRTAIGEAARQEVGIDVDPIPNESGVFRAAIEIGYCRVDDSGRAIFLTKSLLDEYEG